MIDNSKLSNPEILCVVSKRIVSSLAFGILPVIHGTIQPLLPPCILSEVRACRKSRFLSTLLRHHLPSLQGIPTQWTMEALTCQFYVPPQERVPVKTAVYVPGKNCLLSAEWSKSDFDDDDSDLGDKYLVQGDAWKKKGLIRIELTEAGIVTQTVDSVECTQSFEIEDKRTVLSEERYLV